MNHMYLNISQTIIIKNSELLNLKFRIDYYLLRILTETIIYCLSADGILLLASRLADMINIGGQYLHKSVHF